MKAAKERVYEALTGSGTLQSYVGDRIYHHHPPVEVQLPCITYRQVAGHADTADGVPALGKARIEVKIWGETGLEDIAAAVISALSGVPCRFVSEVDLWDAVLLCQVKALDFEVFAALA